ncbi:PAS domain S-box protein [Pedobacter hartonius]|uniref:histidine kinase n=1 Tax=Pedobacter hartonius TaxID=425514 RepID=A0A1H4GQA3_9SPHI|nr:PAS domain S-box protein [Pedobacter hartonius]SEB11796.1 PAS domain S-box-containing protein [Pedobacter hartonius]
MAQIIDPGDSGSDTTANQIISNDVTFRKLIENSFSGITLLDIDLQTIYRSPSAERIVGWSTADRMKKTTEELTHPSDREMVKQLLKDVLISPGIPKICTFQSKHFKGHFIWLQCSFTNMLHEPDVNAIVCNFLDVTEYKLGQEKVVEGERFTKNITDNVPAMIAYWTADLHCLFANKALLEWFEKTPQEMQGIHKQDLIKDEYLKYEYHIQNVLEGRPQSFERPFFKANGKMIYTHTEYVPDIRDGKVKGFYSLIYDYSEVRSAGLEVLKKTAQIEDLLENITDGFIALDENRCFTYANGHIGKMFGKEPGSLIGHPIWTLFPEAVGSATYQAIETAYSEKKYICNEDYYLPLNLWQENRVYPSGDGLSIFIRDISERKNEEMQKALLSAMSLIFKGDAGLNDSLSKVLEQLVNMGNFNIAEAWLTGVDKGRISKVAQYSREDETAVFFNESADIKTFAKGAGLPGMTWQTQTIQFWPDIQEKRSLVRITSAKKAGLKSAYGLPLLSNGELIGVLVLGLTTGEKQRGMSDMVMAHIGSHLGAEIKRKQLEQELNQVFRFTPDILCIANTDGYFKKVNPAMSILLGYSEEELLSKPYMDMVHLLDKENTITELQNIINGSPTYYIENRYLTKSGKVRWLAWTTTGASEQGTLYCSAKDITDKKEMEALLHKATTLARIGGWEIDLIKETVYWSAMTKEIHEVPEDFEPDLETGVNFYKEGESRILISRHASEAITKGISWDLELQLVTARGKTKWVRVIGEPEFAADKCIRIVGSFQDIDALKKAEIAAKETLEERNTILESIGDAFFAVDKNWTFTYWNSSAEQVLGKSKEQMMDYCLWDVFNDSIESISYKKYHEALEINQPVHFEDHYAPLNKWYEISAYPTGNGLSVYFKDTTDRKMSENSLKELNESLQKHTKELAISNAELEQFAYVASHDLQEPLRMVTSFLTQLEQKYGDIVDAKGKQYIHFAVDGAKRMRQIILDLLEFSRVGRSEDTMEEVNINKVVTDILALYRKQIQEQGARIVFESLPALRSFRVPIRQVFQNLISNALKYQQKDITPLISISCEDSGNNWKFAVKDNGIGIDAEYFDKIFIIFQRLHNKDEYSGTGMGLAVTKKIIENLGGRIWVESEEGKGSTFYFTILKHN